MEHQVKNKIYICPMHPEIFSDTPGRCPKCGMALELKDEKPKLKVHHTEDKGLGVLTWRSYMPLLIIILMIGVSSLVVSWSNGFLLSSFILYFMTGFFLIFSGFKLMDLKGFAEGYSTYDLLAKRWFGYGYMYPFIELTFGLLMLSGFHPDWLLWTEFVVMMFSGIGVAIKLAKGEEFQCACLGTFLKVPLTKVTLVEDFGMALLALILLII
jgi:hypothetical protein